MTLIELEEQFQGVMHYACRDINCHGIDDYEIEVQMLDGPFAGKIFQLIIPIEFEDLHRLKLVGMEG
jgi:hypothetical protein